VPTTNLFDHAADAKAVAAGTTIFQTGDPRDGMFAVVDGQVDKENRTATAVARTDSKIVTVDERRFLFLVQQTPNFALHVMRVLSERLRRMDERFVRATRA
jgi:CRP/FNR family cyclic AMP-dependent transcriptional regulator